jgi:transcriptional regulator with XRE-family HTH domain
MKKHDWQWESKTRGGQLLREAMQRKDLSFRKLGNQIGIHYVMLNHYAMGEKVPTLKNSIILNDEFNIPFRAWMKGT